MKIEDIIFIAAGLFAAFVIFNKVNLKAPLKAGSFPTKITEYDGYNYFTDGTVIAPNGDYYYQGALLWAAAQ